MRKLKFLCCQKGQMFVETALVLPVVLVVALIAINLFKFADMCSKFDRVAADQIIAHGISSSHSANEDAPIPSLSPSNETTMSQLSSQLRAVLIL